MASYDEDLLRRDYLPEVKALFAKANQPIPDALADAFFWPFSRQGFDLGVGEAYETAKARHLKELEDALGLTPPVPLPPTPVPGGPTHPLVGYLRTVGTSFGDDTGPRQLRLCSYFPAVRVFRDRPAEFRAQLDRMVGYWHGARIFWCLMGDPWDGVSSPHKNTVDLQVDVRWPEYDDLFVACLREFAARGLRVAVTSGTLHPHQLPNPTSTYPRIARLCKAVNEQTVIASSIINEPGATSPYGDGWTYPGNVPVNPAPWAFYLGLSRAWQAIFPWGHHGTGCQGGDPEATQNGGSPSGVILGSRFPATMGCKQGTRFPAQSALERAFDAGYHLRPAIGLPLFEEEPSGEDYQKPCVFQPLASHDDVLALYTLLLITGQGVTYLNSPGLWESAPINATWGFRNLPRLWAEMGIPEDVGQWKIANLNTHPITGSGMYRCDGAYDEARGLAYAVVHGSVGPEPWRVGSRWKAQAAVYRSDGLHLDKAVSAGEDIFTEAGRPVPTVVRLIRS